MNTFRAFQYLNELTAEEQKEIFTFCSNAEKRGNLVSIRAQEIEGQTVIYGLCEKTAKEFADYKNNGGIWGYDKPQDYMSKLFHMEH